MENLIKLEIKCSFFGLEYLNILNLESNKASILNRHFSL